MLEIFLVLFSISAVLCYSFCSMRPLNRTRTKSWETEGAVSECEQILMAHTAALLQELMEESW